MEDGRKRLSHYVPAGLVEEFNKAADEHEPALQRQVYFEHIIRLGMIADVVLEDMVRAMNSAENVFDNMSNDQTGFWRKMAEAAQGDLKDARLKAMNEGVEFYERNT
jgi:hypothetical protein